MIWVNTFPSSFLWRVAFAATLGRFNRLGLRCGHQLHAQAAGLGQQASEVALLPAVVKFGCAAVDPNLPLGNQPIV